MSIAAGWTGNAVVARATYPKDLELEVTDQVAQAFLATCPPGTRLLDLGNEVVLYRYVLSRSRAGYGVARLAVIGLNPSTADGTDDDNTIRKLMGFSSRWGFAGFDVINVFAYRTKSPKVLLEAQRAGVDIVGPENDRQIAGVLARASLVLAAWGADPIVKSRRFALETLLRAAPCNVVALKTTKSGAPYHPLYVPYEQKLMPFTLSR